MLLGVDASPLMTWGSIEGTPLLLETDVTPGHGPTFKIPHVPRREAIAHQLADKATKSTRERKKAAALAARFILLYSVMYINTLEHNYYYSVDETW